MLILALFVLPQKKKENPPPPKVSIVPFNIPSILAHVQNIIYHNQPDSFAMLAASVRLPASSFERILVTYSFGRFRWIDKVCLRFLG